MQVESSQWYKTALGVVMKAVSVVTATCLGRASQAAITFMPPVIEHQYGRDDSDWPLRTSVDRRTYGLIVRQHRQVIAAARGRIAVDRSQTQRLRSQKLGLGLCGGLLRLTLGKESRMRLCVRLVSIPQGSQDSMSSHTHQRTTIDMFLNGGDPPPQHNGGVYI